MKHNIILSLLFTASCFSLSAQPQLEVFQYEGYTGLVHKETLEEIAVPRFEANIYYFSTPYIGLKSNDSLYIFGAGKEEQHIFTIPPNSQSLRLWNPGKVGGALYHFNIRNKTGLVDKNLDTVKTFPRKYKGFIELDCKENHFVFVDNQVMDIYNATQWNKPVLENIKASQVQCLYISNKKAKVSSKSRTGSDQREVVVFYGRGMVWIYDIDFKLIRKVKSNVQNTEALQRLLEKYYDVQIYAVKYVMEGSSASQDYWKAVKEGGNYHYHTNMREGCTIKINKKYYTTEQYISSELLSIFNTETRKHTYFKVIAKEQKALIPVKYQQEMGFEFINEQK